LVAEDPSLVAEVVECQQNALVVAVAVAVAVADLGLDQN
jgi:hypothetical protein